ncbi:hypothetical protein PVA45_03600 [Entomospira entomophila]|uniref:Uncharacterized protein n=1 Tax=Entomospira entomophila TaxID=2719988 RepID=A0A968G9Q8_9SPIO|nr:hypothetical protein [Entomospira entomophilus]NIZ40596.1 hypothetical protein [Entomospira entomophilus]WDI34811.1 hypothetical protein PVA45_03600 [Entomospira entomophilus]
MLISTNIKSLIKEIPMKPIFTLLLLLILPIYAHTITNERVFSAHLGSVAIANTNKKVEPSVEGIDPSRLDIYIVVDEESPYHNAIILHRSYSKTSAYQAILFDGENFTLEAFRTALISHIEWIKPTANQPTKQSQILTKIKIIAGYAQQYSWYHASSTLAFSRYVKSPSERQIVLHVSKPESIDNSLSAIAESIYLDTESVLNLLSLLEPEHIAQVVKEAKEFEASLRMRFDDETLY